MKKLLQVILMLSLLLSCVLGMVGCSLSSIVCRLTGEREFSGDPIESLNATCTEDGYIKYKCSNCGYVAEIVIEKVGHNEVTISGYDSTCTTNGKTDGKYCNRCTTVLVEQQDIVATGHNEVLDGFVLPTKESTGLTEGSHCSNCGHIIVEQVIIPNNHIDSLGNVIIKDIYGYVYSKCYVELVGGIMVVGSNTQGVIYCDDCKGMSIVAVKDECTYDEVTGKCIYCDKEKEII